MAQHDEQRCACGRDATDVMHVATEDDVLLIPVCAECGEDPTAGEQRELFGLAEPLRRPPAMMPPRDDDAQQSLPLHDATDEQRGAA